MLEHRFPHPLPLPHAFPFPPITPKAPHEGEIFPSIDPPLLHPKTLRGTLKPPGDRAVLPNGFLPGLVAKPRCFATIPCQILPATLPPSPSPATAFVTSVPRCCFRPGLTHDAAELLLEKFQEKKKKGKKKKR